MKVACAPASGLNSTRLITFGRADSDTTRCVLTGLQF